MKASKEMNTSSYRVLKTLQCLFEEDLTMNELIEKLNMSKKVKYNNFVVSKYVNTCKCCGIDIQKVNGKYALMNVPFGEKFSDEETVLMYDMMNSDENIKSMHIDDKLLTKLHLPLCKSSNGLKSSVSYRLIKLFEKSISEKSDVELIYRNNKKCICSPNSIKTDANGKIVFNIISDGGCSDVYPDEIADIKISNKKVRKAKVNTRQVIFELRDELAKRYQLRENEQVLKYKSNGTMVVINKYEDKEKLFRRLMRYDYLCKIVKPKEYAEEFKTIVINTLSNYGI